MEMTKYNGIFPCGDISQISRWKTWCFTILTWLLNYCITVYLMRGKHQCNFRPMIIYIW